MVVINILVMIASLDQAQESSSDPPTTSLPSPSHLHHTGGPGRPRFEIDPEIMQTLLSVEPKTEVARVLGCSARTVRRRQLDVEHLTGVRLTPQPSALSDGDLDEIMTNGLTRFPFFGRGLTTGMVRSEGHIIPEQRVRYSFARVNGAPRRFLSRTIQRRKYHVAAVNSLWHHDGQHGT